MPRLTSQPCRHDEMEGLNTAPAIKWAMLWYSMPACLGRRGKKLKKEKRNDHDETELPERSCARTDVFTGLVLRKGDAPDYFLCRLPCRRLAGACDLFVWHLGLSRHKPEFVGNFGSGLSSGLFWLCPGRSHFPDRSHAAHRHTAGVSKARGARGSQHHGSKFASTSVGASPWIEIILWREVWPRSSCTELRGQSSLSARNLTSASLAAESTGGAVTLIFNSFPIAPPISFFEARGCTLTARQTAPLWTVIKPGEDIERECSKRLIGEV